MNGKRTSMTTFALLFASFLLFVSGAVPLTRYLLRDPTGVLQGFQARTRLPTVAFSPDGTRLGVLGHGAVVTLWDVASGQKGPVLKSQGTDITALAFDPSGRSVAGVGADDRIILWDLSTGADRLTLFPGPLGSNVRAVGFSPDGTALASLGDDSSVIVWDAATGNATYVLSGHSDAIAGVAFSPDGKLLASASRDSTVALWDLSIGKERVTLNSPSPIERLAFSADGGTLAGVGQEGHILLWSSATGKLDRTLAGHAGGVTEALFSPDGRTLASVGTDTRITLWDAATGRLRLTLGNQAGVAVNDVAFSPDGKTLASATDDTGIGLWEVGTGRLRGTLADHDDSVASVTYSPDGRTLASIGKDEQVIVWDLVRGTKRFTRHIAAPGADAFAEAANGANHLNVAAPADSPANGSATGIDSKAPNQLRDVQGVPLANITSTGIRKKARRHDWKGITTLAVSPDGALVGTAGEDSAVRLWDATGSERFALAAHHGAGVTGVAFGAGGTRLVSAGRDTEVQLWNVTTGIQSKVLLGHEHPIRTIAASPDGKILAAAGEDTRILLWDAATGKLTGILSGHTNFVNSLAFSGDGKQLASGDADARVLLWDMATGKLVKTLLGHSGEVNALAFSRNGSVLVSAGEDTQVKVWNAATGQEIRSLLGHQAPLRAVAISPNGQTVVSAGEDTRILVWDVASGQLRRALPKHNRFINALAFDPTGRLFVGDEDEDLTEWDVALGTKIRVRRPSKPPRQNKPSSAAPPATSQTLGSLIPSDSGRSSYSSTTSSAARSLRKAFGAVLEWLVPSAAAQLPDPNQGPGGPILVVTRASSTFGRYYAEILRSEGLNLFAVSDISSVNAATLASYDAVILAPVPLSIAQVGMFTDWVNAGGNLIAMRPDPQLSGLLGISAAGATLSNAYLLVDTNQPPGNGIVGQTIQFHGTADRYTLNGASSLATLYVNAMTTTSNPAVTLRSVGANGGQAAAFAYDLATSIVYTRQGNPLWAAQERDGFTPIRSDDKFFGNATGDPQPDWVDLNKVAIPQADEQQRLLANLILHMNLDRKPLPRFWYFPRGEKAVVVMTGDDHANGGTKGRFNQFISSSPAGCSVANWDCVRGTSYIYPNSPLTNAEASGFNAAGFEVGVHINANCPTDFTPASLENDYTQQISDWTGNYPSIPPPITQRHHCIVWSDWVTGAIVQFNHGIRLDTSYYFWPPDWALNRPGLFTGSAMPMRFAQLSGALVDVYNATTQMTDESGQEYPFTVNTLLDRALGPEGYYGAYTVNAHTDVSQSQVADAVVASALARSVPIVSSRQMLAWLDGRNNSSFGALSWSGNTLSFSVTQNSAANGLQALVPRVVNGAVVTGITRNGSSITFTPEVIKGVSYAVFLASSGTYAATFGADTTPPTVISHSPSTGATGVSQAALVTATFSEDMDPATIGTSTFELRGPGNTLVTATVTYNGASRTATLDPSSNLLASTSYTATVKGGATGAKDAGGLAMASDFVWTFTTEAAPCSSSCSGWSNSTTPVNASANDPNAVELGVKFRSDLNGFIAGIRFYKGAGNTGTHVGRLWTAGGTQLATATFTSETASGWQQVSFATPVSITANTVYVASYHAPNGGYAFDANYFASSGFQNGPLYFLRDGESGGNGLYVYGAGGFPTNTFQASNYWVDVVFTTSGGSDTTPPTVITKSPTDNATGVSPTTAVTATFNEPLDPATVNTSTFELRDSTGALVTATVSSNANTATLTPNTVLANSATYTATVKGGAADPRVKDVAGNALAANATWPFTTVGVGGVCGSPANGIVAENCLTGNAASEWDVNGAGNASIQGFATGISVNRGQTVSFKIGTSSPDYRLDIYRMGYYGGAGARKITTVQPSATLPQSQPACLNDSATGLIDCGNWAVSASWSVPATATSGIYFAKVVREDGVNAGQASHIVFVVRDDASTSNILFQTSDTTWQAYNNYGGNSLYTGSPAGRAYKVSYNRPFSTRAVDNGQDWLFNAEYPMVRWLEANGYDVSYFTGVDADSLGNLIQNHKIFLSVGHDEYWSGAQRTNVEAARNAGVSLAFLSGNEIFWKTRWENSIDGSGTPRRTLVCYKETHANAKIDPLPNVWTGTWRDPRFSPPADGGRPENALAGTIFMVNDGATTNIVVPEVDGKMRFWRNTSVASLASGSSATLPSSTLGYEWDMDLDNGSRPAGLFQMSTTTVPNAPILSDFGSTYGTGTAVHHLTLYRHTSGARVFGAGTVQWSWGLDNNHDRTGGAADVRMQQATVNLFADLGNVQPATIQSGLIPAATSTDATAPSSAITSPTGGANIAQGTTVTITGTAADTGGGVVGGVEVSVDGGTTWHPAVGRASWSYAWVSSASGNVTIRSRAVDDSGNIETPATGVTVTVGAGGSSCTGNTIWPATAVPAVAADADTSAVELGVKFRSDVNGTACGVRFYKGSTNTGTHVGKLWSSGGTLLAQATFTGETASGWQQVTFSSPVAITANTVYVASYHAPNGRYAANGGYFTTGVDSPPLHALQDGVSGGNGVYLYGAGGFPTNTFNSSNYWVDVVVIPGTAPTLASIAVTPANPTIQTSATQQFTATGTYSDSSTQNITTQVTWASSNTAVATINSAGLATAGTGAGTTTISATSGTVSGNTTLTVQAGALSVTTASLPNGTVGTAYSATLAASGGTAPYTWSLATGSLPVGLTLSSSGAITGTPTASGTFNFTVQATDSANPATTASKGLSINVTSSIISTGFLAPSANAAVTSSAGDNNGFQTIPSNAYILDGQFAIDTDSGTGTGTSCTGSGKDKHNYFNYNFIVPSGVAIRGIEVRLAARVDSTANSPSMCAQLSWNGGTSWTTALSTTTLSTATTTYVLGGATNTWGRTWTVGDLSNANFRVRIIDVASSTARDFSLDGVAVQVTYQ